MAASDSRIALESLLADDLLIPAEDRAAYEALRESILADLQPRDGIEQIWAHELVAMTWEHQQLAALRAPVLSTSRRSALQSILGTGHAPGSSDAKRLSELLDRWAQRDADATSHVEELVTKAGYDMQGVIVIAHRKAFAELDGISIAMAATERRRERLLRELGRRQEFAARVDAILRPFESRPPRAEEERLGRPPTRAEVVRELRAGRR